MTTTQEITPCFYAKFEPCDPEMFENLQGKFSLCYLRPSGDDVTICAHAMRCDDEGKLKSNLVYRDPPSVRAKPAFRLYNEAAARFLKNDIDLYEARALYIPSHGEFVQVPLDDFKAGHADKMRRESEFMRQPYYDEMMRRCGVDGEALPLVPFGCELLGDDACGFYFDPLTGEPVVVQGSPLSLASSPLGGLYLTTDKDLIAASDEWRKKGNPHALN